MSIANVGKYKSIKDIKVGDVLWGFNDKTFEREVSIVEDVNNFIPQELYEVEMENGKKFFATGDHRVVSNGKWLKTEEMLHNFSVYDIMEI